MLAVLGRQVNGKMGRNQCGTGSEELSCRIAIRASGRAIADLEISEDLAKPGYTLGAFGCASPQSVVPRSDMTRLSTLSNVLLVLIGLAAAMPGAEARQFKKPVFYPFPQGSGVVAIVAADFNHDGNLDLVVAEEIAAKVSILRGRRNGSFGSPRSFPVPNPVALAVGDFDGDHNPDLAVIESGGTGNGTLGIYLNNGDGTFRNSASYPLGAESISLVVADFDGDGRPDIAVTNRVYGAEGSVMVFLGKGNGKFAKPTTYNVSGGPFSIVAGDLNGDHHPDLVVTQFDGQSVAVFMNTGHGKFKFTNTYPANFGGPRGPALADLRHNGILDLVVSAADGIDVYPGNGDGTFGTSTSYSTDGIGQGPNDAVVADFNRDGNLDIATVLSAAPPGAALLYGNGDGTFQAPIPIKFGDLGEQLGEALIAADFNHDGAPDLAIAFTQEVAVLLNAK
jgi:hypothetical protein